MRILSLTLRLFSALDYKARETANSAMYHVSSVSGAIFSVPQPLKPTDTNLQRNRTLVLFVRLPPCTEGRACTLMPCPPPGAAYYQWRTFDGIVVSENIFGRSSPAPPADAVGKYLAHLLRKRRYYCTPPPPFLNTCALCIPLRHINSRTGRYPTGLPSYTFTYRHARRSTPFR